MKSFPQAATRLLLSVAIAAFALLAVGCASDPDPFPEKFTTYLLLCPNGMNGCTNQCATSIGLSPGDPVPNEKLGRFNSCSDDCELKCNTSFLLLLFD